MKAVGLRRQQRQSQQQSAAQRSDMTVQVVFRTHSDSLSKAHFLFCPRNFNLANPVAAANTGPALQTTPQQQQSRGGAMPIHGPAPAHVDEGTAGLVEAIVELSAVRSDAAGSLPVPPAASSVPGTSSFCGTASFAGAFPGAASAEHLGSSGNLAGLCTMYYATSAGSFVDLTSLAYGGGTDAGATDAFITAAVDSATASSPTTAATGPVGSCNAVGPVATGGWICRAMAFNEKEASHASGAISVNHSLTSKCPIINELAKGKTLARVISSYAEVQERYGLSHVELSFEHHFVSRSDMFLVSEALRERIIYEGEELQLCGFRFRVREMLKSVALPASVNSANVASKAKLPSSAAVPVGTSHRHAGSTSASSPFLPGAAAAHLAAAPTASAATSGGGGGGVAEGFGAAQAQGANATALARMVCGLVCPETRINFHSLSPVHYIVIELATEMWETTIDGRVALLWALKRFVRELVLHQIPRRKATPLIRVVFTGRLRATFRLSSSTDVFHMLEFPREARDVDMAAEVELHCEALVARVLREVQELAVARLLAKYGDGDSGGDSDAGGSREEQPVAVGEPDSRGQLGQGGSSTEWRRRADAYDADADHGDGTGERRACPGDRTGFAQQLAAIRRLSPKEIFSHSRDSNTLEALSIILERCDSHYIDCRLDTTGHNITIVSAGKGVYQATNSVVQVSCAHLHDVGIEKVCIVCVGRPPLHATPLLEYSSADISLRSQYHLPMVGEPSPEPHTYHESPEWAVTFFYHPRLEMHTGEVQFDLLSKEDWLRDQQQHSPPQSSSQTRRMMSSSPLAPSLEPRWWCTEVSGGSPTSDTAVAGTTLTPSDATAVVVAGAYLNGRHVLLPGLGLAQTALPAVVRPVDGAVTHGNRHRGDEDDDDVGSDGGPHCEWGGESRWAKGYGRATAAVSFSTRGSQGRSYPCVSAPASLAVHSPLRRHNGASDTPKAVSVHRSCDFQATSNPHSFIAGFFRQSLLQRPGVSGVVPASVGEGRDLVKCTVREAGVPAKGGAGAAERSQYGAMPQQSAATWWVRSAWFCLQDANTAAKAAPVSVTSGPQPSPSSRARVVGGSVDESPHGSSTSMRGTAEGPVPRGAPAVRCAALLSHKLPYVRPRCHERRNVVRCGLNMVDSVLRSGSLLLELTIEQLTPLPLAAAAQPRETAVGGTEDSLCWSDRLLLDDGEWCALMRCFHSRDDRLAASVGEGQDEYFQQGFRAADIFVRGESALSADAKTLILQTRSNLCNFQTPEELLLDCPANLFMRQGSYITRSIRRLYQSDTGSDLTGSDPTSPSVTHTQSCVRVGGIATSPTVTTATATTAAGASPSGLESAMEAPRDWEPALRQKFKGNRLGIFIGDAAAGPQDISSSEAFLYPVTTTTTAEAEQTASQLACIPGSNTESVSGVPEPTQQPLHDAPTVAAAVSGPTVTIGYVQLRSNLLFAITPVNPLVPSSGRAPDGGISGSTAIAMTAPSLLLPLPAPGTSSAEGVSTTTVFQRRWQFSHPDTSTCVEPPNIASWTRLCACRMLPLYGAKSPFPRDSFYAMPPHQYTIPASSPEEERCRLVEFVLQRLQQQYQIVVDGGPTASYPMRWPRAEPMPNARMEMSIGHQTHTLKIGETARSVSVTRVLHRGMYSNGQVTHMLSYRYALWNYLDDTFSEREMHMEAQVGETNAFCWEALDRALPSHPSSRVPRGPDLWLRSREAAVVLLSEDSSRPVSFESFVKFISYRFCAHLSTQGEMSWSPDSTILHVDISDVMPEELPRTPDLAEVVLARDTALTFENRSIVDHATGRTVLFEKPVPERFISLDIDLPPAYHPGCCYYLKVAWLSCDAATVADWYGAFLANAARYRFRAIPIHCYYQNPKEECLTVYYDVAVPPAVEPMARRRLLEMLVSATYKYCSDTPVINRHCRLVHRSGLCFVVVPPDTSLIAQWRQNTAVRQGSSAQRALLIEFQQAVRRVRREVGILDSNSSGDDSASDGDDIDDECAGREE